MTATIATFSADGDSPVIANMNGNYAISIEGTFGGGTVQFVFLDDQNNELTNNTTDWSFSASPEFPQSFGFPCYTSFIVRLSGSTSPNLTVKAFKYYG